MPRVINLTAGEVVVGDNEFVFSAHAVLSIPNDRYFALQSEFLALVAAGQLSIGSSGLVYVDMTNTMGWAWFDPSGPPPYNTLILNGTPQVIDLSALLPPTARLVNVTAPLFSDTPGDNIRLSKYLPSGMVAVLQSQALIANSGEFNSALIPMTSDLKIRYIGTLAVTGSAAVVVTGYFMDA